MKLVHDWSTCLPPKKPLRPSQRSVMGEALFDLWAPQIMPCRITCRFSFPTEFPPLPWPSQTVSSVPKENLRENSSFRQHGGAESSCMQKSHTTSWFGHPDHSQPCQPIGEVQMTQSFPPSMSIHCSRHLLLTDPAKFNRGISPIGRGNFSARFVGRHT